MIVEAILLSIIIGLIRGGKISRLLKVDFKKMWVLIFGIVFQYLIIFLNGAEEIHMLGNIFKYTKWLILISYLIVLIGILLNLRYRSLWAVLIGNILNFFVIVTNFWKKPILKEGVKLLGLENLYTMLIGDNLPLYTAISDKTKYSILGDVIVFSKPYPFPHIMSIGDLIICFGLYTLIQEIMLSEDEVLGNTLEFNLRSW